MHQRHILGEIDFNGDRQSQALRYVKSFIKGLVGTVFGFLVLFSIIYFSALSVQADENRIFNDFYMEEPHWADTSASSDIPLQSYNAATGYRGLLPEDHKKAYDDLEKAIRNMDFFCAFEPGTVAFEDVETIYFSVLYDNPDILWCGSKYLFLPDLTGHALGMFPIYLYDAPEACKLHAQLVKKVDEQYELMKEILPEQMAERANEASIRERNKIQLSLDWQKRRENLDATEDDQDQSVEQSLDTTVKKTGMIMAGLFGSFFIGSSATDGASIEELEKELEKPLVEVTAEDMTPTASDEIPYISNCVEQNLTYDHNEYDQTASAFVDDSYIPGKTVCVGYAKTYKLLCDRAGIECYLISGCQYGNPDSSHAWNMAYAEDGDVYFIDATWADDDDSEAVPHTSSWCSSNGNHFEDSHMPNDFSCNLQIVIDGNAEIEAKKAQDLKERENREIQSESYGDGIISKLSFFKDGNEVLVVKEQVNQAIKNMLSQSK